VHLADLHFQNQAVNLVPHARPIGHGPKPRRRSERDESRGAGPYPCP